MKTTVEIPDALFRKAKATAAERGQSLKDLMAEALHEKLAGTAASSRAATQPDRMRGFGKLRRLRRETARIQARIDAQFQVVEREDRL
jgi:hypothetical protein